MISKMMPWRSLLGALVVVTSAPAIAQAAPPALDDPCATATPFAAVPGTAGAIRVIAPKVGLRLAVADTEAKRERGLMCVTALAHGDGMIFVFPGLADADRSFWMKDTLVPLDMVFVAADGRVTAVAARVPSTTPETPDRDIPTRHGIGKYVIELGAGEAARDGIGVGTHLHIPGLHGS